MNATEATENDTLESMQGRYERNKLEMELKVQEAQIRSIDRALSLEASRRSLGSAGGSEAQEELYSPEDYIDIEDYRRDNYGYQAYAATFTSKTDRQDGRNWPYWVSEPELAAIRGTVRLLATYNKHIIGIQNKLRDYTVGKGFQRKIQNKVRQTPSKELMAQIEYVMDEFDRINQINANLDQEVQLRRTREGEVPIALWHRGDGYVDMRIAEPDCVSEPTEREALEEWLTQDAENNSDGGLGFVSNWSFGVHTTKGDVGSKHGYYVQWTNNVTDWDYFPGGNQPCYPPSTLDDTWMEFFKTGATDNNIKRGVSDYWPLTGDVELARKMIRNLTHAGALQAAIAWIREMAPGTTAAAVSSNTMATADWQTSTATQNGGTRTSYQQTYQPGTTLYLGSNQRFIPPPWLQQSIASGMVAIYEAMLRSIAVVWSMPEHMITGSTHASNYASILEAGSPFVKAIETRQTWLVQLWINIYWKVIYWNWKAGKFGNIAWEAIKRTVEIVITPPQVDVRDRFKETQRNILLLDAGIISRAEFSSREGVNMAIQIEQGANPKNEATSLRRDTTLPSGEEKTEPKNKTKTVTQTEMTGNPQQRPVYESIADSTNPTEFILALAKEADVDITGLDPNELRAGILEEMEHDGSEGKDTKVINSEVGALKIAIAHLRENPHYYTKLHASGLSEQAVDPLGASTGINWKNYP